MNFDDILRIASENQGCKDKEQLHKRGINTSLGKPKRDPNERKSKGVKSAAVQAFLKKKEAEERKKAEEDQKKKENLMKLREEKRTVGKLKNIIKRNHTKEAIFEVEGASKKEASAKTPTLTPQKDEEKNGKVEYTKLKSQFGGKERKAIFQNVKRVQVSAHWVPKSEETKEEKPDNKEGHDSKKSSSGSSKSHLKEHSKSQKDEKVVKMIDDKDLSKKSEKEVKKKKKPQGPPPLSFNDLLKIAEQKKTEPAGKEQEVKVNKDKKVKMPDRPMTQEEKERWMRVHSKEYQAWIKHGKERPDFCISKPKKRRSHSSSKGGPANTSAEFVASSDDEDEEIEEDEMEECIPSKDSVKSSVQTSKTKSDAKINSRQSLESRPSSKNSQLSQKQLHNQMSNHNSGVKKCLQLKGDKDLVNTNQKESVVGSKSAKPNTQGKMIKNGNNLSKTSTSSSNSIKMSSQSSQKSSTKSVQKDSSKVASKSKSYNEVHENVLVCGPSNPSGDKKQKSKKPEAQMSTWDRIYGSIDKKKKPEKKKRVIESDDEDEYDEEMDDFIEDDDEYDDMDDFIDDSDAMDYSKHIRDIFGYDKNKYRNEDEDVSDMEVGYSQVMREEMRSAKLGLKEDLEDMRAEAEHKKRKMAMKKQALKAKKKKYH